MLPPHVHPHRRGTSHHAHEAGLPLLSTDSASGQVLHPDGGGIINGRSDRHAIGCSRRMEHNNRFRTLADAVDVLQRAGYTDELVLTEQGLLKSNQPLDPSDFRIDSFHRFEGPSDPADMSIVYAISSVRPGIKGLLIGAYGAMANGIIDRMVRPLDAHHPEEHHVRPVEPIPPGSSVKV